MVVLVAAGTSVHPDGGGAYAVGKKDLGATVSLLAAASLVVDYPSLRHDLLAMTLSWCRWWRSWEPRNRSASPRRSA